MNTSSGKRFVKFSTPCLPPPPDIFREARDIRGSTAFSVDRVWGTLLRTCTPFAIEEDHLYREPYEHRELPYEDLPAHVWGFLHHQTQ